MLRIVTGYTSLWLSPVAGWGRRIWNSDPDSGSACGALGSAALMGMLVVLFQIWWAVACLGGSLPGRLLRRYHSGFASGLARIESRFLLRSALGFQVVDGGFRLFTSALVWLGLLLPMARLRLARPQAADLA